MSSIHIEYRKGSAIGLDIKNHTLLFSYDTLVGILTLDNVFHTSKYKYSQTTTKHITQFINGHRPAEIVNHCNIIHFIEKTLDESTW